MSERPWLEHYPPGTPTEIDPPADSLPDRIREAARRYENRIAFTQCMPNGMNGSLRFRDVDRLSDELAVYHPGRRAT